MYIKEMLSAIRKMRQAWILVLVTLFQLPAQGQPGPTPHRFEHISPERGSLQGAVLSIIKDQKGVMWFGTVDGLNKFDGYTFTTYRHSPRDPSSLSDNVIWALQEDHEGTLWVGTENGLNVYDRDTDTFIHYAEDVQDSTSLSSSLIRSIYEDRQGTLWIGTFQGLNKLDRETMTFTRYLHDPDSPSSLSADIVRAIHEDSNGNLWVGTDGGGLNLLNKQTDSFTVFMHVPNDPSSLSHNIVDVIHEDRSGQLWIGTYGGGLNLFDATTQSFVRYQHSAGDDRSLSSNMVDHILEDRRGNLWIATDGGGLNKLDPGQKTFSAYQNNPFDDTSLGSNVVRILYEDNHEDLWIGLFPTGIDFLNRNNTAIAHYQANPQNPAGLSENKIFGFSEEPSGNLWIGTDGGGLNYFDRATNTFTAFKHDPNDSQSLSANAVLTILEDHYGTLWLGTFAGGLNRFDRDLGTFQRYLPDAQYADVTLSNPHVWAIHEDGDNNLWLGTMGGGLNRMDRDQSLFYHYRNIPQDSTSLSSDLVWMIYEDRRENLWVGTHEGLNLMHHDTETFTRYQHDDKDSTSLGHNWVLSMHEDQSGTLWVGTHGGGLNRFDQETETFKVFQLEDGLASDVIYGILEDNQGRLWLSTNNGLSRFDPSTSTFTNFEEDHWLQGRQFNIGSYFKSQSGAFFFGGTQGFNSFYPDSIKDNMVIPPVIFTDFQVFNQPVRLGDADSPIQKHIHEADKITLRHDQSVFTLSYAALSYRNASKNQYAYRLEGFDDDWNEVGTQRTATYTNLDPGTYTFRVKAANSSGFWNDEGASIDVEILPPFWRTWWFQTLSFLTLLGLLIGLYQVRTRRIRNRNRVLQAEITVRKRAEADRLALIEKLETTNSELERKNAELERFTYTVSHDLKSPLVTIRGFLGLLKKDLEHDKPEQIQRDVTRIQDATEKMHQLLEELLELSRIGRIINDPQAISLTELAEEAVEQVRGQLAERNAQVDISPDLPTVYGDRVRLLEVLQNLIDNAVKFTSDQAEPKIEVGVRNGDDEVICHVTDNGIGIEPRYHDKIFGLFERLDAHANGTGIGLALVKRIIEVHGGRIWVESEGHGKGASFCFTLPQKESANT